MQAGQGNAAPGSGAVRLRRGGSWGEQTSAGAYLRRFRGRSALILFEIALSGLLREREGLLPRLLRA